MRNMKLTSVLLAASSFISIPVLGQSNVDEIKTAINVLKGKDNVMDKTQALNMLELSQQTEKNGKILNVLGVAYLHGIGTDADTTKAIAYFEEAGTLGYSSAYHNLGMYYKYAPGERQNFEEAFNAFKKGANLNSISNSYNCGFMKYKGLGCVQSYKEAIEYFLTAAKSNHADALYMLGLCYRNGYGVETDTATANSYLRQASILGCSGAMEELLNEEPENGVEYQTAVLDASVSVPESMPSIEPLVPWAKQEVTGCYRGYLATYDWSGTNLISEKPLSIVLEVLEEKVSGLWVQGKDSIRVAAVLSDEGILHFDNTEADFYDRYAWNYSSRYRFDKMEMNYNNGRIVGQLRLYSLDEQEPERPMYVCLEKSSLTEEKNLDEEESKLYAYSVPSSNQVILSFNLKESINEIKVSLYNKMGTNCLNYKYGPLEAGKQSLVLPAELEKGYYTIRVEFGVQQLQTIIVK